MWIDAKNFYSVGCGNSSKLSKLSDSFQNEIDCRVLFQFLIAVPTQTIEVALTLSLWGQLHVLYFSFTIVIRLYIDGHGFV